MAVALTSIPNPNESYLVGDIHVIAILTLIHANLILVQVLAAFANVIALNEAIWMSRTVYRVIFHHFAVKTD